jgi:hypothetical protein
VKKRGWYSTLDVRESENLNLKKIQPFSHSAISEQENGTACCDDRESKFENSKKYSAIQPFSREKKREITTDIIQEQKME